VKLFLSTLAVLALTSTTGCHRDRCVPMCEQRA
jgi:hypothetical protein